MTKDRDPVISAQVLLKTARGARPRDEELTAANIQAITPKPDVVSTVTRALASAGFEVGPVVGLSVAISARQSVFESFFAIKSAGAKPGDIPLDRLPPKIRQAVAAVTFPPPPEFGPGSYS